MNARSRRTRTSVLTLAAVAALALALALPILAARPAGRAAADVLGGADRYLTHVSTDKPIYREGDALFLRGVVLHALDGRPLPEDATPTAQVTITGPKGETVATLHAASQDSVVGLRWDVPAGVLGGQYTATVTWPWEGYAPAERRFEVRAYRPPRLKNQIVFLRDGYGPGDVVVATLHSERAEGGVPAGAAVTLVARVDGAEVFRGATTVDGAGNARAEFPLPERIARGEGTLAFVVEDGGVVETAAKTIPILLQTVDLALYPEGGDLVTGLRSRVYVEARTPAARPADVAGVVIDDTGRQVATFRTEHEGRGRFAFTPEAGRRYTVELHEPGGIETTYPLPDVRRRGAVIRGVDDVTLPHAPVRLRVGATDAGRYLVTIAKRGEEVGRGWVRLRAGRLKRVSLKLDAAAGPSTAADGVLVATLWNPEGRPVAERLVFRDPARVLQVRIAADTTRPVPGDTVSVTVETLDDDGAPVSAVVGLTVSDESVVELLETREQPPRLPVMVLVEDDVRELADAHVYLDPENEAAPRAVDLLLGTQGWRRFAFLDPAGFLREHGAAAKRVLGLRIVRPPVRRTIRTRGARRGDVPMGDVGGAALDLLADGAGRAGVPADRKKAPDAAPLAKPAAEPERPAVASVPAIARRDEAESEDADDLLAADRAAEAQLRARALLAGEIAPNEHWRAPQVVAVREYAHAVRPDRRPGDRVDFTETLYWHAGVRTDPETGRATVTFGLNDAVTTFRVTADAFDATGALGAATQAIESVQPFYVEPKLPIEVTAGDRVVLPVNVVSGLATTLGDVRVAVETGAGLRAGTLEPFALKGGERARRLLPIRVGAAVGTTALTLEARAGGHADRVTRTLAVAPRGFPAEVSHGGTVAADRPVTHEIVIPRTVVPNSVTTEIALYPTPLANLTGALAALIREPYGCFEQTSSTTYPLMMAQQYFTSHAGVDPSLVARSKETLAKGYQRLTGFECAEKGYEWFGADPGHEALTAYGLMEFTDMAQVHAVDREMLDRTRAWLLAQRDGDGGFARKRRALHTWIEDQDCSDGYILWALLESGEPAASLETEIAAFERAARKSDNSYVVALGANVMALAGRGGAAEDLMARLSAAQEEDGHVGGATQSIVGSRGNALDIETTSLAALAWLRAPAHTANTERAMRWLTTVCEGGRYGSTQSTVLALRAILAYDAARARPKAAGRARVRVDGQPVGDWVAFDETSEGVIPLPDPSELLAPGTHRVAVEMEDGAALPYGVTVRWHQEVPASSPETRVALSTELLTAALAEGEVTEATVTVTNRASEPLPMVVAIVGLPGGLEPRHDRLKELKDAGTIAAWEIRGREVILYWRSFAPAETKTVALSLVAAVPGTYTAPASRAYEYYGDEHKVWAPPLRATVEAR